MKTSDPRILLRAVDECGSVHRWWLEPRAGWQTIACPRPWQLTDWATPRGYALDRIRFENSKNAFSNQFFAVRIVRTQEVAQ